jgi:hypothetical protein
MKIEVDEVRETLTVDGEEFYAEGDGTFSVLEFYLRGENLRELPVGIKVTLVNRVGGSRDTFPSFPSCTFERISEDEWLADTETAFTLEDERIAQSDRAAYLQNALAQAHNYLAKLEQHGRVLNIQNSLYDDIAYIKYSLRLEEQTFKEAQEFVAAIEERVHEKIDRPLLFVCHASEDKAFAEHLVHALDRSAMYAWFDKREVLVGDSIVAKIQDALQQVRYVVALLSRSSIKKPWVQRELNSTLMRQLAGNDVQILPALLDNCEIPLLLADMKYADFRNSFEAGYADLLAAIRRPRRSA